MTVVVGGAGDVIDEEIGGEDGRSGGPSIGGRVVGVVDVGCSSVGECRGTGCSGRCRTGTDGRGHTGADGRGRGAN